MHFLKAMVRLLKNSIIFTIDPESGRFYATDRKLAEHLDFVPYLGKERDFLLRGEFKGDVNNDNQPVFLGLWSVENREDLENKLKLLRNGANTLIGMGLHPEKKISFYQTTYPRYIYDVDTYRSLTLRKLGSMDDDELLNCTKLTDDEFSDYAFAVD